MRRFNRMVARPDLPHVKKLNFPRLIMSGFPVIPKISFVNCNEKTSNFAWFRKQGYKEYEPLAETLIYTPTQADIGHHLKFECFPSDGVTEGPKIHNLSPVVSISHPQFLFEKRQPEDYLKSSNQFRVVSYNILADLYAGSQYSKDELFKHCPNEFLNFDYRRLLLTKEITGYHSDITCLQEVDEKMFRNTLNPYLKLEHNFSGIYDRKAGSVQEGLATFFRNDKFELIENHKTRIGDLIKVRSYDESVPNRVDHPILKDEETSTCKDLMARFNEIRKPILSNPKLESRFCDRHNIIQTCLLRFKSELNRYLIVANTHLYFAPDADHVRLLQGSVCVKYIEYLRDEYYPKLMENLEETKISTIFCGDMNSSPDCGLYSLLTSGVAGQDLIDWQSNEEEKVENLNVTTGLRMASSYQDIPYTNYTPKFNGCLDYIYYDNESLACQHVVPMPSHEDVIATDGLPSKYFPSDHLALISELRLV